MRTQHTDVVVIGTGAAGLLAALRAADHGADVVVLEKSSLVGGTTAVSAGGVWIPDHPHLSGDSREAARTYMCELAGPTRDEKLIDVYLETGPDMVRWVEENTPLRLHTVDRLPDYFPQHDGACPGGRTLDPGLYDTTRLGAWADALRRSPVFGNFPMSLREVLDWRITSHPSEMPIELLMERSGKGVVNYGAALVGPLLEAALERGIEPRLRSAAAKLIAEGGRVVAVEVESADGDYTLHTDLGVVLACGGFEWNAEMVERFLPYPVQPLSPPGNDGDGLRMAMALGADLVDLHEAWWCPALSKPGETYDGETFLRGDFTHRALPHGLVINGKGQRFVNEATNYHDFSKSFFELDAQGRPKNLPAWLVVDGRYLQRYSLFDQPPGAEPADWLVRAETIDDLAAELGVPTLALRDTVSRFNEFATCGVDRDFRRGDNIFDRLYGDPDHRPHPCLGTLEEPPFVAVPLTPGVLGTKGGLRVDKDGRVQHADGGSIAGLFAVGNVMVSCAGAGYPGGGTPIGIGMTFAYRAGRAVSTAARATGRLTA
ncbi:MAG: FAD-dependent oxidoreductase [Acidobacteriota bacterium]